MVGKEFPSSDVEEIESFESPEERVWDESKLKLIEYSLGNIRNDTFNVRNNRCMQKQGDDSGFQATTDGFDTLNENYLGKPMEDIVGSGGMHEKFVIKGGLKIEPTHNGLTKISNCINGAQKSCDSASDKLEANNVSAWKKTKTFSAEAANSTADAIETGYDAIGNAWDSTVNFLKHPWSATQTESVNRSVDLKNEGPAAQGSVDFTKNKTSSAWENTTNFVNDVGKTGKAIEST